MPTHGARKRIPSDQAVTDYSFHYNGVNALGLFIRAYGVVIEEIDIELRRLHQLSLSEFTMLFQLHRSGGRQRGIDLSRGAVMTPSRVTRHLDKLQERKYIERHLSPDDRRVVIATLTPMGEKAYTAALKTFLEGYEKHFTALIPEQHKSAFLEVLTSLYNQRPFHAGDTLDRPHPPPARL